MWVNHSGHSNFHIAKTHVRCCDVSTELKWGARGEKQTIISAICSIFISKPWLLWYVRDDDYTREYYIQWTAWGENKFTDSITAVVLQKKRLFIRIKTHNITPFIDAHCKWSLAHYWGLTFREIIMNYQSHMPTPVFFSFCKSLLYIVRYIFNRVRKDII